MLLDLDAARAARAEKPGQQGHTLRLGGQMFNLPAELPFAFGAALTSGRQDASVVALRVLLDGQYDAVIGLGLSAEDWGEILRSVPGMYGFADQGESPPPSSGSKDAGKRPRRTSSASTG